MSTCILVYGESGAGKTTSLRTLNAERTFIIDADRKGLNWKGWKKQYNGEKKNYVQTANVAVIRNVFSKLQTEWADKFDTVVIDGLSTIMVDDEMERMKEKGYDRWISLAQCIWGIISEAHLLRDNLTVVFIGHVQTERDENGYEFSRLKTSGRKLDKIVPESKFTTVLYAKAIDDKYVFETYSNHSTAKSPLDCFEEKQIPNDMQMVINTLRKYEDG